MSTYPYRRIVALGLTVAFAVAALIYGAGAGFTFSRLSADSNELQGLDVLGLSTSAIWAMAFLILSVGTHLLWQPNRGIRRIAIGAIAAGVLLAAAPFWASDWLARAGWAVIHH
jgi:hypothetical protein